MEHLLLKAVTAAKTDQGIFDAVISSASIDREKDVIYPDAMVKALQRWIPTGKKVPLAWQHSTKAEDIIGWVDPTTAHVVGDEVVARGWVDQTTARGKEAWRLVKLGVLGFSFGYLTIKAVGQKGGGRHISELDVFEMTATPIPMQNDTRVLGWKSAVAPGRPREGEELVREAERTTLPEVPVAPAATTPAPKPAPAPRPPDVQTQRLRAAQAEREAAQIARAAENRQLPTLAPAEPAPKPEAAPTPPDAQTQRQRAAAVEHEAATVARATQDGQLPQVPPEAAEPRRPSTAPEPSLPDPALQREKAISLEATTDAEARAREEAQLPTVPSAPPEPLAPVRVPVAPDATEQREKAISLEAVTDAEARAREEAQLPTVPSAPAPAPAPATPVAPDAAEQRRQAQEVERDAAARAREREHSQLPHVPPAPASPAPASQPPAPNAEEQRLRAVQAERDSIQEARAREQRALPHLSLAPEPKSVPEPVAEPKPEPVPDAAEQRRRAQALERQVDQIMRHEEGRRLAEIKGAGNVGPDARNKLRFLIRYYMSKPHPFTACVHDNTKRFGPDGADRICATLKDIGAGTTHWRSGGHHGKAVTDPDWEQILYDAANGDLEALIEMWHEWMMANGDQPPPGAPMPMPAGSKARAGAEQRKAAQQYERDAVAAARTAEEDQLPTVPAEVKQIPEQVAPAPVVPDAIALRLRADRLEREAARQLADPYADVDLGADSDYEQVRLTRDEAESFALGDLKSVWTAAQVNELPDSAFLYIEPGGQKDLTGRVVPRSYRHFPYRDVGGSVDLPHLHSALKRIPDSDLPQAVKDRCSQKARQLLDQEQSAVEAAQEEQIEAKARELLYDVDVTDRGRMARSVDPLRNQRDRAERIALEYASGGVSLEKPPQETKATTPEPQLSLDELRRVTRQEMLNALSGGVEP